VHGPPVFVGASAELELVVEADGVTAAEHIVQAVHAVTHAGTAYAAAGSDDGVAVQQVLYVGEHLDVVVGAEHTLEHRIHVERGQHRVVVDRTDVGAAGAQQGSRRTRAQRHRRGAYQTRAIEDAVADPAPLQEDRVVVDVVVHAAVVL